MLASLLLFIFATALADFQGDVVLRITPKTDGELDYIRKLADSGKFELDIWRDVSQVGENVDIHVKAADVDYIKKLLKENNIIFSNMIDNLQTLVDEEKVANQQNAFWGADFHDSYHSYNEIVNKMNEYARASHVSMFTVPGRTYEGKTMQGVKFSTGGRKEVIWIDGGIHAREWISPATVMYFADHLTKNVNDPDVRLVLSKYDIYILPVFNVDGYEYSRTGNRMWRKTRSRNRFSRCMGADPNRNWGYKFGGAGTSRDPCRDTYHGESAFSEVEVRSVANYLKRLKNSVGVKSYWNIHAYSQLVLTPWPYTTMLPPDYSEIKRIGDVFANAVRRAGNVYYRVGPPSRVLYAVGGGSMDWTYHDLGIKYSYALELRDTGRYGFMLPPSYIKISGRETTKGFLEAIKAMI